MHQEEILFFKVSKIISDSSVIDNKDLVKSFIQSNITFSEFFKNIIENLKDKTDNKELRKARKLIPLLSSNRRFNCRIQFDVLGIERIVSVSVVINSIMNLFERFFISENTFKKLRSEYYGEPKEFTNNICKLLYRYSTLWQYQSFLSEENLLLFQEELGCKIESFSSPLFRVYEKFCSLFEEDKLFGSLGNFFSLKPQDLENIYDSICMEVNPPFIYEVIQKTVDKIIEFLQLDCPCCFIFLCPDWYLDSIHQKIYERSFDILEIHPEKLNFSLYTKYFQKINYYKTSLTVLIIRNDKGKEKYTIRESFIQRLLEINKSVQNEKKYNKKELLNNEI